MARWLIACESSGRVRQALRDRGHDAYSADLKPAEDGSRYHFVGDVRARLRDAWDGLIAFPPCTDLAGSGARWFPTKRLDGRQDAALAFVAQLLDAPIRCIALENPVGIISSRIRRPNQIIQPWQYGHGEVKTTCLWLKGLPKLTPTAIVAGRDQRIWKMAPSPTRATDRARTYPGIALAMAAQWGDVPDKPPAWTLE